METLGVIAGVEGEAILVGLASYAGAPLVWGFSAA